MRELKVSMEISGENILIGRISGNSQEDACFLYDPDFLDRKEARPISISLPLQEEPFSGEETKRYFEGLLPEGFTRRSVAQWMHVDEGDYLSILSGLGKECLGALQVTEKGHRPVRSGYEKLSPGRVLALAREGTSVSAELVIKAHLSLTGASGKVGLYLDQDGSTWYLPKGDAPSTHILKQSHVRLLDIVANEQLCLLTAGNLGIEVPDSFIVDTGNRSTEDVLFASRRFDRCFTDSKKEISGMRVPDRLHQEDFAQAMGIPSSEKYENTKQGYLGKMFDLIRNWSSDPLKDQLKLWDMVVFDYLVGNTDSHLKNFSLLYSNDLKTVRLAPAYDIVSTAVYEGTTQEMSFFIGSENRLKHITAECFAEAAAEAGIHKKIGVGRFEDLRERFPEALHLAAEQLEDHGFRNAGKLENRILGK